MRSIPTRGKKGEPHLDPADPPRRRANKLRGAGTYARDRPPVFTMVSRDSHQVRFFVREHADSATCLEVVGSTAPAWGSIVYTDDHHGYRAVEDELAVLHSSVRHSRDRGRRREWARDEDGDGFCEVHCNSCEGAHAALRTYLRMFRGVHKYYLAEYIALYDLVTTAKRLNATVIRKLCFGDRLHAGCT